MLDTSARLLRLLSLLQSRREWASADLAERLGVAVRTVRRDVGRLRSLGYPVHATLGVGGGYRLGAGAAMPPLLLDDEEAVAVAVGLRTAAGGSVAGIEEASVRALAKLEQVLPSRLRHRVNTLHSATAAITGRGPVVSAQVLTEVADACRRQEGLRFDYADHTGAASLRAVEPHRLVFGGRRWYLLAWDLDRRDWRTFRVDRIALRTPSGPRFTPRDIPDGDAATYVRRTVSSAGWRYHARVRVHAPAAALAGRLPPAAVLEAVDERTCMLDTGADTLEALAAHLGTLGVDFDVSHPPELLAQLRELADRCTRATQQP
jgi:predicted DNA-binding transcriptional regulator YafY